MIHWGGQGKETDMAEMGQKINLSDDQRENANVNPTKRPDLFGSSISENMCPILPGRSPHSRRLRRNPHPVAPLDYTGVGLSPPGTKSWGGRRSPSPITPFVAPGLGPDATSFIAYWRNQYGNPQASERERLRKEFYEQPVHSPIFESLPEPQTEWGKSHKSTSPVHRFCKLDRKPSIFDPVEVREIDLKIAENANLHHTSDFECVGRLYNSHLVLRRGQHFNIEVTFARTINLAKDCIEVVWEIGEFPKESDGTRLVLPLRSKAHSDKCADGCTWWAELVSSSECSASLRIHIGSNSIVGNWTMKLVTTVKQKPNKDGNLIVQALASMKAIEYVYTLNGIYILFNAWCPADQVYLVDDDDRNEYVMNEIGKIWRGTYNSISSSAWAFDQFEQVALDACMLMLEKSNLPFSMRSSPVQITKTVAAIINHSHDNDGVMEADWTGDYRNGIPPTEWTCSGSILNQYAATGRPVRYGQCWVFAGIVASVCRCLGIPCRVVTNYGSAHDSVSSVSADYHFDAIGRPLKHLNMDSVWSFHVWNDVWMSRPDLPEGCGGWHAIDATPQEKAGGIPSCGPAPLSAIRKGDVGTAYDTAFMFSEVNADVCYWLHTGRGINFICKEKDRVGRLIVSKCPGVKLGVLSDDMQDITNDYKLVDDDAKSKQMDAMIALFTGGNRCAVSQNLESKQCDVQFKLNLKDRVMIGQDVDFFIHLTNSSNAERTVELFLRVDAVMYTGVNAKKIKSENVIVKLKHKNSCFSKISLLVSDYLHRLLDQSVFLISVLAQVKETGQLYATNEYFGVMKPEISLEVTKPLKVAEPGRIVLSFNNPMPVQLTGCKFIVTGPGITKTKELTCKSVMPHAAVKVSTDIIPWKTGKRAILAKFSSGQLSDVNGYKMVLIQK